MNEDLEILLFIKELGRLLDDYKRCPDTMIRAVIQDEILFLTEMIHPSISS